METSSYIISLHHVKSVLGYQSDCCVVQYTLIHLKCLAAKVSNTIDMLVTINYVTIHRLVFL